MDNYNCPISEMPKNFPEKNDVETINFFYGLPVFLFLFFCDDKKKFILKKYLELLSFSILYGNNRKHFGDKKRAQK